MVPVLGPRVGPGAGARLPAGGVVHARPVPRAAAPAARARGRRRARRAVRRLTAVATVGPLRVVPGADVRGVGAPGGRACAGARAEGGRPRPARHRAQQEGVPRAGRALARRARRGRADRVARARLPRGCGPATGGGLRRARAGACDSGRARAGRGRLEEQHRVPRRVPRRTPSHHLVLASYRQIFKRAATSTSAVCDGHVVHPVRGLLCTARLDRAAALLHRALGPRGVTAASAHLLQPPGPAALPHAALALRKVASRRRGDQHFRHRVKPHHYTHSESGQLLTTPINKNNQLLE